MPTPPSTQNKAETKAMDPPESQKKRLTNVRGVAFVLPNFPPWPPPATLRERKVLEQNVSQHSCVVLWLFPFPIQRFFVLGLTLSDTVETFWWANRRSQKNLHPHKKYT